MPSPIPRCSSAVLLSLASHRDGGLRLFRTSSAFTLPFSRLARRSLILWPARSLIAFSATFCTEGFARSSCPLRTLRLLPAGATVAGWVILLPLELRALFHGARESRVSCGFGTHRKWKLEDTAVTCSDASRFSATLRDVATVFSGRTMSRFQTRKAACSSGFAAASCASFGFVGPVAESTVPPTALAECRYARSGNESPNIGFPLLDCSCVASS